MNTRFDADPKLTQKKYILHFCYDKSFFYTLSLHTLGQNLVNQNEKVTHENPHWLQQKVAIKNWKINKSSKSSVRQTTEKTALRFLGAKQVDIGTIFDVICLTSINIE